jgi:allantoinase
MRSSLRSKRVITPEGIRAATVHIAEGRIASIGQWESSDSEDFGESVIMPGVIDTHVHVNEPGRTDWEGFESATRAAAAGGITTILDMPLNSIPATTTVAGLEAKRNAARGKTVVNVEYIGGVIPGNSGELEGLRDAGVRAYKCFLTPSGVEEFPAIDEKELQKVFPILARLGLPLMVHSEDPACLHPVSTPSRKYSDYLASRPIESEHSAIRMLVRLLEMCPTPVHVVHLSSATSLDLIDEARKRGLPLTVETCPHYLTFSEADIPDGATEYKCAPPIRSAAERDGLWKGLIEGEIDLVASDHSPCPPGMKETHGDFFSAWGGIASLQISMPAVWTGARNRNVPVERIAEWMCKNTAKLAGLGKTKGSLAAGYDADIVVWDPDASFMVDAKKLAHRNPVTPYDGRKLFGKVLATYVAGKKILTA